MSITIKVLGLGCANCTRLESEVRETVARVGLHATVTKVEDIKEIMSYRVRALPALVVDGEVKSAGRIPSEAEIGMWLTNLEAWRSSSED